MMRILLNVKWRGAVGSCGAAFLRAKLCATKFMTTLFDLLFKKSEESERFDRKHSPIGQASRPASRLPYAFASHDFFGFFSDSLDVDLLVAAA